MADQIWSMRKALAQIEACGFKCEAGPIETNRAWPGCGKGKNPELNEKGPEKYLEDLRHGK